MFNPGMFEDPGFLGYVNECEHNQKLNNFAKLLLEIEDPNDSYTFQMAAAQSGINLQDFFNSPEDMFYVETKINSYY